jgi:hypothetical protein
MSTVSDINISKEIVNHPNLYKYVIDKCLEKYNRTHGSGITSFTDNTVRNTVNKLIRQKIGEQFPNLHETNENRLQLKASNNGEDPSKICYICRSECSNPQVEHVIRILLLFLLTYHLPANHIIKKKSLVYAHATCNIDAKGTIPLFIGIVTRKGIIKLKQLEMTEIGNLVKSSVSSRKSRVSSYGRKITSKNYNKNERDDINEVNQNNYTIRQINGFISQQTKEIKSIFNTIDVTAHQVVVNLHELIDAIIPTRAVDLDNVIRNSTIGREYGKGIRKNKTKKNKKNNKTRKNKQRSKRA